VLALRPAGDDDEAFLLRLYATTRPDLAVIPEPQRAMILSGQYEAQRAGYSAAFPDSQHLVVEVDGDPAGRLWFHRSHVELRVIDITLLPERQGHGIGTELLRRLIDEGAAAGVPVRLTVARDNPRAIALYRRLGFVARAEDELRASMELSPPASP
jgi:ribosomal protein S18 acetylase RimI-like enzyme